jgi:hypothetical protein
MDGFPTLFLPTPVTPRHDHAFFTECLLPKRTQKKRPFSCEKGRSALGLGTYVLVHARGLEPLTR